MRVAAGFQVVMIPSASLLRIASSDCSTIASKRSAGSAPGAEMNSRLSRPSDGTFGSGRAEGIQRLLLSLESGNPVRDAGEIEQAGHGRAGAGDHRERAVEVTGGDQDHLEAGRVHEGDPAQVEDHGASLI